MTGQTLSAVEHPKGAVQGNAEFHDKSAPSAQGAYVGQLRRELGILGGQGKAWENFAASLRANARRISASADPKPDDEIDLVFGEPQDRLAALAAMQLAAGELLAVLAPAQQRQAARLLPLCCLPPASRN